MTGRPVKKRIDIALADLKQDKNVTDTYDEAFEACGEDFEMVLDTVKDMIADSKRNRPPIQALFLDAGLDIYNAFHWHYLVDALARAYALRKKGGSKKRPKPRAELETLIEAVCKTIDELKSHSTNKYTRVTAKKAFEQLALAGLHGSKPATIKRRYHSAVEMLKAREKRKKRVLKK